ncbi:MAG: diguanylate cyclase [Alphaproteobacteria bacterium]|nr:diguanylate cyclase [Alphaproteobacteria bacterium]
MSGVLVVDGTRFFTNIIKRGIESSTGLTVTCAYTYDEAVRIVDERKDDFFISLLGYTLPGALDGEVIDYVANAGIPVIVFTSHLSDEIRGKIFRKNVIDYILKDSQYNLDYMLSLVARLHGNRNIRVLVVDDSAAIRRHNCDLLRQYRFEVLEAGDGVEALRVLQQHPDVSMIITDYNMPNMDGVELTRQVRQKYARHELSIIGISAQVDSVLSARFIKNGANDFLTKPFSREEFFCRVSQNAEFIEHVRALKDAANRDYLTGLYNRRFLFSHGDAVWAERSRTSAPLAVAMMDVDFFKKVNDTHGHDAGDAVLKRVAKLLAARFLPPSLVARMGGEEFCVLVPGADDAEARDILEALRRDVENAVIEVEGHVIRVTISIGACTTLEGSLEAMIAKADSGLYRAKSGGRNQVVVAE